MRISDWSSDVCSSDLPIELPLGWLRKEPPIFFRGARGPIGKKTGEARHDTPLADIADHRRGLARRRRGAGRKSDRAGLVRRSRNPAVRESLLDLSDLLDRKSTRLNSSP